MSGDINFTPRSTFSRMEGAYLKDDEQLEDFRKLLDYQMKISKIQEARRIGDKEMLRLSIRECEEWRRQKFLDEEEEEEVEDGFVTNRKGRKIDELKKAKEILKKIDLYTELLTKKCQERNRERILEFLGEIHKANLEKYLRREIMAALQLTDDLHTRQFKMPILAMDKKTMSEIRHYSKPSPLVHRVMQAALLLLGEDEGTTSVWTKCQNFCFPDGPNGMNRRIMTFDPETLDPFITKRSWQILSDIRLSDVQRASPGAATFYVWAMGILKGIGFDEEEEGHEQEDNNNAITLQNNNNDKTDGKQQQQQQQQPKKKSTRVNMNAIIKREVEILADRKRRALLKKTSKLSENDHLLFV